MKKSELIKAIRARLAVPQPSRQITDAVLAALAEVATETLLTGGECTVPNLGTLATKERPARMGRNPKTGEPLEIAAKIMVQFRPAAGLGRRVNGEVT